MARRSGETSRGKHGRGGTGGRHAKKGCLAKATALIVATLAVTVAMIPGSSSAGTRATGPFFVRAHFSPVCIKATPDRVGSNVVEGDYHASDCRKMFFDQLGHVDGFAYGQWLTAGGHAVAAPECFRVTLEASHSTGTSWVTYLSATGQTFLVNKRCDEGAGRNCLEVLAADGNIGDAWVVINRNQNPGFFTDMRIVPLASPRPQARAGC
jgi:hypothetical protein